MLLRGCLASNPAPRGDYEWEDGGSMFLIEEAEDLDKIHTTGNQSIRCEPSAFDAIEIVGDYLWFYLATNDGGGDSFFVPIELAVEYPSIVETYQTYKGYYAHN